jgi:hypothetical protein
MALIKKITDIADAVRSKTGITKKMTLPEIAEAIKNIDISGGGGSAYNSGVIVYTLPYTGTTFDEYYAWETQVGTILSYGDDDVLIPKVIAVSGESYVYGLSDFEQLTLTVTEA